MPTNQRLGPNDVNDLENGREPAIQLDEEKAVAIGQPNPAPAQPEGDSSCKPQRVKCPPGEFATMIVFAGAASWLSPLTLIPTDNSPRRLSGGLSYFPRSVLFRVLRFKRDTQFDAI